MSYVAPIRFKQSDIAGSNQLPAGFYPIKIEEVGSNPGTKDANTVTWNFKFVVMGGKFDGTPVSLFVNSAHIDKSCLPALFMAVAGEIDLNADYNPELLVGKTCDAWLYFDEDEKNGGQYRGNKVRDFKAH